MVSTWVFESHVPSSNLGASYFFALNYYQVIAAAFKFSYFDLCDHSTATILKCVIKHLVFNVENRLRYSDVEQTHDVGVTW